MDIKTKCIQCGEVFSVSADNDHALKVFNAWSEQHSNCKNTQVFTGETNV